MGRTSTSFSYIHLINMLVFLPDPFSASPTQDQHERRLRSNRSSSGNTRRSAAYTMNWGRWTPTSKTSWCLYSRIPTCPTRRTRKQGTPQRPLLSCYPTCTHTIPASPPQTWRQTTRSSFCRTIQKIRSIVSSKDSMSANISRRQKASQ